MRLAMKYIGCVFLFLVMNLSAGCPTAWNEPFVSEDIKRGVSYIPLSSLLVQSIEIRESGENLVDLKTANTWRVMSFYKPNSEYSAPSEEYSFVRSSVYERLLEMLIYLPDDIGIVYYEGYRSLDQQKQYFDKLLKKNWLKSKDSHRAYELTCKSVSPFINHIPAHCTGGALDMALFRKLGEDQYELLDMGQMGVLWGANTQRKTFSQNTTLAQRQNRLMLLNAAIKAGFVNYGYEWWHYSYGDRVWAMVKGEMHSMYGLLHLPTVIDKEAYLAEICRED